MFIAPPILLDGDRQARAPLYYNWQITQRTPIPGIAQQFGAIHKRAEKTLREETLSYSESTSLGESLRIPIPPLKRDTRLAQFRNK